jgi:hypothetical protein
LNKIGNLAAADCREHASEGESAGVLPTKKSNETGRPCHYVSERPFRKARCEGESATGFSYLEATDLTNSVTDRSKLPTDKIKLAAELMKDSAVHIKLYAPAVKRAADAVEIL